MGVILLLVIAALIFFGFLHRVLDRMHMNDKTALIFIGAMIVGTFLPNIPLPLGLAINLGGGVVPIIVAVYLIVTSDSSGEKIRSLAAALITGGVIYAAGRLLPAEPETMFIDPIIAYSILAGLIAYIFGRSRRGAFIAGILGIVISDIIYALGMTAVPARTVIGGAGVFDSTIIAGVIAVGLCEIGGETWERLQGGSYAKKKQSEPKEMTSMLVEKDSNNREGEDDESDGKE